MVRRCHARSPVRPRPSSMSVETPPLSRRGPLQGRLSTSLRTRLGFGRQNTPPSSEGYTERLVKVLPRNESGLGAELTAVQSRTASLRSGPPPKSGLDERLSAVYSEHYDFVWRNVRRLGIGDDLVDDVVHEVFLVVGHRLDSFEGRSSIRTWLFAIMYRVVLHFKRSQCTYEKHLRAYSLVAAHSDCEPQRRSDASRQLHQMLGKLSEGKRLVFILADLEGMTTQEVADGLGLPPGTVSTRLRAARLELAAMLDEDQSELRRLYP